VGGVRPRAGKIKGGRQAVGHWSAGNKRIAYAPRDGAYLIETAVADLNDREGVLPNSAVRLWKADGGRWIDATAELAGTGAVKSEPGNLKSETEKPDKPENKARKAETEKTDGSRWTAATPQGNLRVGGHWVIAPRDRFISDTDPRYDFSLQNRSRDAALGSSEQVAQIVANFDAARLLDSPDTATGAPVALPVTLKGADGKNETFYMVLSGNGRFRALDQLDADHRGDEYRNPVKAFADERGIPYDPADMSEAARPRLVRALTRPPVGTTYQRIAELSNQNAVLQMTDAERAYSDAALIERDGTADLYAANRDGLPSRNGSDAFFAWFARAAGDASLMDSQGRPTDAARARARRAMLALAVGRGRRGKETVMAFTEQAEALGLDRQRDALLMSAGALSALGEAKPDYALADEMSRAAADLLLLARERKAGKAVTAAEFIAQGDMLDAMPPAAAEALRILDAARPAEGIAAAFQRYADLAAKIDTELTTCSARRPPPRTRCCARPSPTRTSRHRPGRATASRLAARRYALATGMPAEGERLMARQLEFLFARHMDPAYIASRERATQTRRANAAAAERAKAEARRDAHGRALANPDDPQAWAEAFAASDDGTVSRIAHDFFLGGDGPQRFPHAYGGKPLYGTRVNTPRDAAALLMPLRNPYQESFKAIFLDDKRRVLGAEVCTLGLLDSALVHPRETFRRGIELGASQVILSHNHPSGDPRPSKEDRDITRRLDEAAKLIGLQYIEHIITDGGKYYSLASESLEELAGPGQAAWEAAAAGETRHIREPQTVAALARALRQGAENVIHAVMLDTRNRITAVKRIPFDPARIADPAYQDEALLREAFRGAVANPTAAIILEVTDRAVTPETARALHAAAHEQGKTMGIQVLDTLSLDAGGWAYSQKADARVMPMEADAAAEPAATRYSVEASARRLFEMEPVARVEAGTFAKSGTDLVTQATRFLQSGFPGGVDRPGLGNVRFTRGGVKSSVAHGIGRAKAAAFAAVPGIIRDGVEIDRRKDWKGRGYGSAVIAAPVAIGGTDYIAEVIVTEDRKSGGWLFYLHEVEEKTKLRDAFKTGIKTGAPQSSRLIIARMAAEVNPRAERNIRYSLEARAAYYGDPADAPRRAIAKIRLMTSPAALKAHPDYEAAKAGDRAAAIRVASALSKADRIQALAADHPGAVLVPVRAEEATGNNQLPAALADVINIATGLKVDHGIVQSVRAHRTGQGHLYRMTHRPKFNGDVTEGQEYIIVDDLAAMGGTLAEMRHYIETHGGIVVDAVTLAAGRFGNVFGLTPKTEARLIEDFGVEYLTELLKRSNLYGGNWKYLSEGEGRELLKALPPDAGRDGASAGRGAQDQPLRGRAPGGDPRGVGHPPVRYAIDLTGRAYSKENLLIGFMAHAELTGKSFPSRGTVAAIADKIGLAHHRYDELAQRARALAASPVDAAILKAAMSADPGNVATPSASCPPRRGAGPPGPRPARASPQRIRIRALPKPASPPPAAVTGADYTDIETDTDIDIAASILAADPKAFEPQAEKPPADTQPPAPAGPDADPEAPADPASPDETDEEAPELTDRQRAEIARKRRERETRIQAMLDAARDRAARNRARDEERRRRKAANQKAEAEEEAAAASVGGRRGRRGATQRQPPRPQNPARTTPAPHPRPTSPTAGRPPRSCASGPSTASAATTPTAATPGATCRATRSPSSSTARPPSAS
jgi:DNA repair protein RadC